MKTRTLWLVALLAIGALTLAGCDKTNTPVENPVEEEVEIANPASVYCEENWGILNLEEGLCMFNDGSYCEEWSYQRWECQPGEIFYNTLDDENVDFVLPEWAKTSLTIEELEDLEETHFPKSYFFSTYNMKENLIGEEGTVVYAEDISHTLLIPEHATMASREVLSSGIEDGMIYTITQVTLQDDTVISVLYIVDPVTLNFVAANVENWDITTNYQFAY